MVFEAMPTGGSPVLLRDWNEFTTLVETLRRAHAITSLNDLWWDIRPSPRYGTLEELTAEGFAKGSEAYFAELRAIGEGAPTSADRPRALYERTQSFFAVTRALADEFEDDVLARVGRS